MNRFALLGRYSLQAVEKAQECYKAAKYLKKLLEIDLKPKSVLLAGPTRIHSRLILLRDILTRQSFLNAITIVNVIGGSTNAVRLVVILVVSQY